ncbi:dopamine D2-like receptor [Actinia tenebrosa]|uniref:Dopamine D2-like receptor n=1 Tax=Actinia tenebrosa TaxID=6105 RepID=A0A6P8HU02_ACTTE|nr:dopamine D2-like receptor [Actinia tenebrosa]
MALNISKGCFFDPENSLSTKETKILMVLSILSCVLAIIGNGIILFVVYKKESFQNTSNFFLCSLAVADLLMGLIGNPIRTVFLGINLWTSNRNSLTKFNDFLACQLLVATAFNLCAVSVDRLVAVKWPLRYPTIMTSKTTLRIIKLIWLSSFGFGIPMLIFNDGKNACIYWLFISLLTLVCPLLVILYCYTAILKIAQQKQKYVVPQIYMSSFPSASKETNKYRKNRKAVATFLMILTVFVVCFVPNAVCSVLCVIPYQKCPAFAQTLVNKWEWYIFLLLATSFVNPLLYGLRNRQFRTAFFSLVSKI